MKKLTALMISLLAIVLAPPANAHGGFGGHYAATGWYRGGHGGGYGGGYGHGGGHGGRWVAPLVGAALVGGILYANRPVYPEPVIVQQVPPGIPPRMAYYCTSYQQYYPQVATCPTPWQMVPY